MGPRCGHRLFCCQKIQARRLLIAAAVFSHWPLDLVVHRPDLPLYDNAAKAGLGLWDYPIATLIVEGALVAGGLGLYVRNTRSLTTPAKYAIPLFICAALCIQAAMAFGPAPPSDRAMAITALSSYAILAGAIAWLEKGRSAEANKPAALLPR